MTEPAAETPGSPRSSVKHGVVELLAPRRIAVLLRRERDLHRQQPAGRESGVGRGKPHEADDEEAGRAEQNLRERQLRDDEGAAETAAAAPARNRARRVVQRRRRRRRRAERRRKAEEQTRSQRRDRSKGEHRRVEADVRRARHILRRQPQKRRQRKAGDAEGEQSAGDREREALREELTGQPCAAGAKRHAYGQLPPARGRSREQKVRDVRARDQQEEACRRTEQQDGGACIADDGLPQRDDVDAQPRIRVRMRGRQARGDRLQLRLRPLDR